MQPWGTSAVQAPLAMPKNATTGRRYSGGERAQSLGRDGPGTTVVFADHFMPAAERRRAQERDDDPRSVPFLKRFTVFNTDQCDGLPEDVATMAPSPPQALNPTHENRPAPIEGSGGNLE